MSDQEIKLKLTLKPGLHFGIHFWPGLTRVQGTDSSSVDTRNPFIMLPFVQKCSELKRAYLESSLFQARSQLLEQMLLKTLLLYDNNLIILRLAFAY